MQECALTQKLLINPPKTIDARVMLNPSYTHSQIGPYTLCDNNLAGSSHVILCEMGLIKYWLQSLADSQIVCMPCRLQCFNENRKNGINSCYHFAPLSCFFVLL